MTGLASLRRAALEDLTALISLQRAAYARNREILGCEPLPLMVDYAEILKSHEVWLAGGEAAPDGALILEARKDDLLIWSVAVAPAAQGRRLGNDLLAAAETRARELGHRLLRLYTGEKLEANIAWYRRHGYAVERVEALSDRNIVHMVKAIA
ncbi:Acetyltransferase (GNAT) family protein [Rhizobiales bacterium GAS188]|nr:Acetyltransferase (GNAT) family protein [Rhizobiales bacterium GAS188]